MNQHGTKHSRTLPARDEFPLFSLSNSENFLYLNSSFQMPLSRTVRQSIEHFLDAQTYELQPKVRWLEHVEVARCKVAEFIGAEADDVAFTKNTSEGINAFVHALRLQPGDNVVVMDGEHPNQVYSWMALEAIGVQIRRVSTPLHATAATFENAVDSRTKAIGLSWVMFHSGQKNDIHDITSHYRPQGIHVLVDATQGVGFIHLNVVESGASAVAFSCHKGLGTPCGLGILYIDPSISAAGPTATNFQPGARRFESGNLNYLAIHAIAAYIDLLDDLGGIRAVEAYLYSLTQLMIDLLADIGVSTVTLVDKEKRSSHSVVLKSSAPAWQSFVSERGCQVSSYRDGMRVSLGIYNSEDDVYRFVQIVEDGLKSLQQKA